MYERTAVLLLHRCTHARVYPGFFNVWGERSRNSNVTKRALVTAPMFQCTHVPRLSLEPRGLKTGSAVREVVQVVVQQQFSRTYAAFDGFSPGCVSDVCIPRGLMGAGLRMRTLRSTDH